MGNKITYKRFMGVTMIIDWGGMRRDSPPTHVRFQIPIHRYVRSISEPPVGIQASEDHLLLYTSFFNEDEDIKNLLVLNACRCVIRYMLGYDEYTLERPSYSYLNKGTIMYFSYSTRSDLDMVAYYDDVNFLAKCMGYKKLYDTVKKMSEKQIAYMHLSCLSKTDLLDMIARRWHDAINQMEPTYGGARIHRIRFYMAINDCDSSYWFQKGAINDRNFEDGRYMTNDSYYRFTTTGDWYPPDGIRTRLWLRFHRKVY